MMDSGLTKISLTTQSAIRTFFQQQIKIIVKQ